MQISCTSKPVLYIYDITINIISIYEMQYYNVLALPSVNMLLSNKTVVWIKRRWPSWVKVTAKCSIRVVMMELLCNLTAILNLSYNH